MNKGDAFKIIALASPLFVDDKRKKIEECKTRLENFGYKVDLDDSVYQHDYYQSVSGEKKAKAFEDAVNDESIDVIMSMRGGYSAVRMLENFDLDVLDKCYKPIIGYSDLTILLNYFAQKKKMITLHGPMFATVLEEDHISYESLFDLISSNDTTGYEYNSPNSEVLYEGVATGQLFGGNLTLIATSIGTQFEIDITDRILFIEEISEDPYAIDGMLTQLKHAKFFEKAAGVVFGNFLDCTLTSTPENRGVKEIVLDILGDYNKPVIFNFDSGHVSEMLTLPIGANVKIDNGKLSIIENIIRGDNE